MFHHQKSSKSSDDNLEINLLQTKDRQSRVNMVRVNHNNIRLNRLVRASAHIPRMPQELDLQDPVRESNNPYDNYSAINNVDFSESLLTDPHDNNPVVGVILFALLIALSTVETLALCASQEGLEIEREMGMLEYLIVCELAAFGIVYWFEWVERVTIFKQYMQYRITKDTPAPTTLLQRIAQHPYLLFFLIFLVTSVWQFCYIEAILDHESVAYLILLYFIILPGIVGSIWFEEELANYRALELGFYGVVAYLLVAGFVEDFWVGLGGVAGILLICLSIRMGRVVMFMEYISKAILLFIVLCLHVYSTYAQDEEWEDYPYSDPDPPSYPPPQTLILLSLLTIVSLLAVRCINNKILRAQLYKYFYSDHTINNALLCLPLVVGYLESGTVDVWVSVLGCGVLFGVGWLLAQRMGIVEIQLDDQHGHELREINEGKEGKGDKN